MNIPKHVSYIINTFEKAGFEAYAVGGCVRDYLLGKKPKDWDITTSALPADTKRLFPHTFDTGIAHGTVTVVCDKINYEVTTYRIDGGYSDFRRPDSVIYTKKIDEDLSRRDFTMNAIAYNKKNGFRDPYNGRADISAKIIKGVGDPDKRFKEDALRMLRGVRFCAQLNFEIEENTYASIIKNSGLIKNISRERIRDELSKLLLSSNPEKITILKSSGLLKEILPIICKDIYPGCKTAQILKTLAFYKISDLSVFYAAILRHLSEKETHGIMKELKFDSKTIKETAALVKYISLPIETDKYEIRKTVSKTKKEFYKKIIEIRKAVFFDNEQNILLVSNAEKLFFEIIKDRDCCFLKELNINGNIIKSLGISDGNKIGAALNSCLDFVLKNPDKNTEADLIKYISLSRLACES